jgi:hypothetical protein
MFLGSNKTDFKLTVHVKPMYHNPKNCLCDLHSVRLLIAHENRSQVDFVLKKTRLIRMFQLSRGYGQEQEPFFQMFLTPNATR